jgi:hypothetical protein
MDQAEHVAGFHRLLVGVQWFQGNKRMRYMRFSFDMLTVVWLFGE